MTNEEMQKAMEFIPTMEARSSAKIDALGEKVDGLAQVQKHAEERWARTEESIRALLSIAEIHAREINPLSENGRATDERLNTLISVVERQISQGRNGKQ